MVSTNHCQFRYDSIENRLYVHDLNSTNGLFVNGLRINCKGTINELFNGDTIRFGKRTKSYNHEYIISIDRHQSSTRNPIQSSSTVESMDIDSLVQDAINREIAEHRKKMEVEFASKHSKDDMDDIKQRLYDQNIKDIEEKKQRTDQQHDDLEKQRREIESMRQEMERKILKMHK